MDIKDLQCFLAAAQTLNFSKAAKSLYISQPSLSQRIQALEQELGAPLFYRNRQQMALTGAGRALLPRVQTALTEIDLLPQAAREAGEKSLPSGEPVRILLESCLSEKAMTAITAAIQRCRARTPGLLLDIASFRPAGPLEETFSEEADIRLLGLKPGETIPQGYSRIILEEEPLVLVFSGEESLSDANLLASRKILLPEGRDRWNAVLKTYAASRMIAPDIAYIKGQTALTIALLSTPAVSFMPRFLFESLHLPGLHSRQLDAADARLQLSLLWKNEDSSPAVSVVINALTEACLHLPPAGAESTV